MQSCLPASTYKSTHVYVHPYTHKPRGGRERRRERGRREEGRRAEEGGRDGGGEKRVLSRHMNPLPSLMIGFQSLKSIWCVGKTVLATHMPTDACIRIHSLTHTYVPWYPYPPSATNPPKAVQSIAAGS